MNNIFLVQHGDDKIIGIYSSQEKAEHAVKRASQLPGFIDNPNGFSIDTYILDQDYWQSGFQGVS